MDVLFVGSKDRGVRCLEALLDAGTEIVGVITVPDDDPDAFWEGSVERTAAERGLSVQAPKNVNDSAVVDALREMDPDLIAMSGYNQVLGSAVLSVPDEGVINLHAGKLPDYRGGSPMNWAILNGETSGTATIHYATERIDAGDILAEREFEIGLDDTIADVRAKTLELFPEMLVDVVKAIDAGEATTRSQDVSEGAYWGSRIPEDGRIHWDRMSAKNVYDFIRALTHPYPGAFTAYGDDRLYVWEAELLDGTIHHAPGRIMMRRGEGRVVGAADRSLVLKRVQLDGEPERDAASVLDRGEYLR